VSHWDGNVANAGLGLFIEFWSYRITPFHLFRDLSKDKPEKNKQQQQQQKKKSALT